MSELEQMKWNIHISPVDVTVHVFLVIHVLRRQLRNEHKAIRGRVIGKLIAEDL